MTVTSVSDAEPSRRSDRRRGSARGRSGPTDPAAPWWRRFEVWFPVAVFLASRLVVVAAATYLSRHQMALVPGLEGVRIRYPVPADPGYWQVMSNWDGQWYRAIAEEGYPKQLPRRLDGGVDMNPWAFFPVFPMATGLLMRVTGLPFVVAAPLLSTVLGFAAVIVLFRLVDRVVGRYEAIVVVVSTSFYVASPVFSASYTESLALLLIATALLLLHRRRYGWFALVLLVLALSRNVVVAMVPVVIAHAVVRYRAGDEGSDPPRTRALLAALTVWAALLTFLWPTVIRLATGVPDAYNQTMQAWRISTEIKLKDWWQLLDIYGGGWAQAAGLLAIAAFAWFMLTPHSWRWGPEIWGWAGAYPAYIILISSPTASRVRYALLAFPFALVIAWALERRPWRAWRYPLLAGVAAAGGVLMWWYVENYIIIERAFDGMRYP